MNPGIFYFYYYTPDRPPCNVGFLKFGQHFQSCSLELHIRNIPVSQGTMLKLGTFYEKDRQFPVVFLSDISTKTNAIFAKFDVPQSLFSDSCTLSEICGFFLLLPDGNIIAATAPNIMFEPKLLQFHTPSLSSAEATDETALTESSEPVSADAPVESNEPAATDASVESNEPAAIDAPVESNEPVSTDASVESNEPAAADAPIASNESVNALNTDNVSTVTLDSADPPVTIRENVRKISRRDLRILPRKYWNIANNSFLMHGYHNYNHLLLVEKDGYYMIGVPGIYSLRESHAASLFGFPSFTDEYNQKLALTDEEQNDYGTFGYWCCEIR